MDGVKRLRELDSLRGVAALAVLLHHNLVAAGKLTGPVGSALAESPLLVLLTGRQAVMFFFVLSGFVLTRSLRRAGAGLTGRGYLTWVAQRTVRLCLPATAALVVSTLLYAFWYAGTWPGEAPWLVWNMWQVPPTTGRIAREALLMAPNGYALDNVLWSLAPEWRLSLLLPVVALAKPFHGRGGAVLLVLVGLAMAGLFGGPHGEALQSGVTVAGHVQMTLYFALPFLLGAALQASEVESLRPSRWQAVAGLAAVPCLARIGSDLAAFAASAVVIWLALQPGLFRRALRHPALTWLGTVSFSLYLTHELVLVTLHHGLHERLPPLAICALSLAAALPAAWLFYVAAEDPAQRLARLIGRVPTKRGASALVGEGAS